MAVGLQVVVSRVCGNSDVIEDKKYGFLFTYLNDNDLLSNLDKLVKAKNI